MTIPKGTLSLAGEYAVASEICRKGYYTQITLGNLKATDILVYNTETGKLFRIEVKSKQKKQFAWIKGVKDENHLLVFVDFWKKEDERPDFYVLNLEDWKKILDKYVRIKHWYDITDDYVPVNLRRRDGTPRKKEMEGITIHVEQIEEHKDKWEKLH